MSIWCTNYDFHILWITLRPCQLPANPLGIGPFSSITTATVLCLTLIVFYLEYPSDFLTEFFAHNFMVGMATNDFGTIHYDW